jgi:Ca2+-binding EF-hand superfamily protein
LKKRVSGAILVSMDRGASLPELALPRLALAALLAPLVLAGAAAQDPPALSAEELRAYFATCDRDSNGWIAFREARDSLGLDREAYAAVDVDRDGRIVLEEFSASYVKLADKLGGLPRPKPARPQSVDLPRDPLQILTAYDSSGDSALSEEELAILLFDYGRSEIPAQLALEKLDEDGDAGLRGGELELLARLLATLYVAGPNARNVTEAPSSIAGLFGRPIPRPGGLDQAPQPPLIVGPVPLFRRLDLDDDGGIEDGDLRELLSPLQLSVSLPAIKATLDFDESGDIDEGELERALGG